MMEDWLLDNMHGVLIFIEVLWVAGFLSVFVLYFVLRWHFKKKSREQQGVDEQHQQDS